MHRGHWQTQKCTLINAQTIFTCVRCYKDRCAYIFFSMNEGLVLLSNNDIFGPDSVGFWRSTIDDLRAMGWRARKVVWEKYFSERNRSPLSYSTWSSSTWSEGGECCKTLYVFYMLCFHSFLFVFFSNLSICRLFPPYFFLPRICLTPV